MKTVVSRQVRWRHRLVALMLFAAALSSSTAFGVTYTWSGLGGNVNWGTAGNWVSGPPTSANTTDLIFTGSVNLGSSGTPLSQNIASPMLLNNLTFDSNASAFFLNGNPLRWEGASNTITQSSSNAQSIANNFSAPSTNSTFTLTLAGAGSGVVTLSGVISSGSGNRDYAIVKSGNSTFALTGTNTYGGGTTINGGTLQINNASSLGTAGLTINAGTLQVLTGFTTSRTITLGNSASSLLIDSGQTYTVTNAIGGTGALNKNGAGTMVLNGANTYSGGTVVNAGTLRIGASDRLANAGAATVAGGTLDLQTFTDTVGTVTLGSGSIIGSGTLTGSSYAMQSGTASANLNGSGIALTKTTSGTVTLSGTNTYTGGTNINAGTLSLGSSGALGSSGTISFGGGTMQHSSSNTTDYSSRFSTAASQAYNVDSNGQSVTWATALTSSGGTLAKAGTGTLTLTGTNTFSGATTVNAGTLSAAGSSGAALGSTSGITVNSGGTLSLGASNQINNSATLTLAGGTFVKGNFSEGSTSGVGVGALTLSASGSHLDFGTGTVGVLSFTSLNASTFTITIDNWTGNYATLGTGSTDRLIFDNDQTSNLSSFVFTGFGTGGLQFDLGNGYFEVVAAVPETTTWVSGTLASFAILGRHVVRHRRRVLGWRAKDK